MPKWRGRIGEEGKEGGSGSCTAHNAVVTERTLRCLEALHKRDAHWQNVKTLVLLLAFIHQRLHDSIPSFPARLEAKAPRISVNPPPFAVRPTYAPLSPDPDGGAITSWDQAGTAGTGDKDHKGGPRTTWLPSSPAPGNLTIMEL